MKICIDAQSIQKEIKGIGYYTLNLIQALSLIDRSNEYYLYCRKRFFDRKRRLPVLPGQNFRLIVDRFKRGVHKCVKNMDVFHSSDASTKRPGCRKFVVTIHDVINKTYPVGRSQPDLDKQDLDLMRTTKEADLILTDVDSTKKDIVEHYSTNEDKIKTVYPGRNEEIFFLPSDEKTERTFRQKYQIIGKYILFVGTIEPRKNIDGMIESYQTLKEELKSEYQLIFVGGGDSYISSMREKAHKLKLDERIIFTGYIPREDLNYFYNYCSLFLFPSYYEGFGFPILEAMACRRPVITSNVSSCQEIALDYAITVDPRDTLELKNSIERILCDTALKNHYSEMSQKRAEMFSWKSTAENFLRYVSE